MVRRQGANQSPADGISDGISTVLINPDQPRSPGRCALRRLPQADDVARMVEHLLGDGGRDITGSVLTTDAGNTRELDSIFVSP